MLPIPFDHSLYLLTIAQLQLSPVLLAKNSPRGVIKFAQEETSGSCPFAK